MAKAPTPANSRTSITAVVGYEVSGPPPLTLPPHHQPNYERATIEEDEFGKYVCIPLVDTDPFGFEKKKKGVYKCKFCRSEQCHPGTQCSEQIKFKKNLDIWRRLKKNSTEMRKGVQELSE